MAQIKKDTSLRKALLQAAITGQLISDIGGESLPLAAAGKPSSATPSAGTPRNAPTETGKQLLDRIIEERNKKLLAEWEEALKKNPKAKKPAPIVASEIDEDEIPFEIPENWCWCRLGDLISISSGDMLTSSQMKNGKIPVYGGNGITGYHNVSNIHEETIVIGRVGFYCGSVHLTEKEAWVTDNAFITSYSKKCLNREYLIIALRQLDLGRQQNKTAQPVVSGKKIYPMIFPLPPLSVQNAIVAKLEQVLPLVDAYENAVLQKEELKSTLSDKVKKAILQEAITGKLTEQWRKSAAITESGEQLLDRIIKERNAKALAEWEEKVKTNPKAKKPAPIVASEIEEDEIPFEIPESWCWCRLGDVGDFVRGSGIKRDEIRPDGFPCIRYGEMYTKYRTVIKETVSFVDKTVFDSCQKIIKNDIAMALTGENEYDIALAAVYQGNKEVAMGGDMTRLRPCLINPLYLVFTLNSPYGIECKSELATGNIIVHISNDKLASIMIPLPPLEEQEEIVKKVKELLPLCK